MQTYKYPCILDSGKYFIEVIVMFCDRFNPSNYTYLCMESVYNNHNVVNLPYAEHIQARTGCAMRPRWKTGKKFMLVDNKPQLVDKTAFLPTRHQRNTSELTAKEYCSTGIITGFCNPSSVDIAEYSLYKWIDAPAWQPLHAPALALATVPEHPVLHMCYVGDSHSMHLVRASTRIPGGHSGLTHDHIMRAMPSMFNISSLEIHKCSVAVFSFGQWMFSNGVVPKQITREKYTSELRKMITLHGLTKQYGRTKIFYRTENINGLGSRYTACPPLDYRSMSAIRMLNDVIRELSVELNLNFIDLTHIQGVHWDRAPDFNHPAQNVFDAQLQWILHSVLSTVVARKAKLTTYAVGDVPHLAPHNGLHYRAELDVALAALDLPP